MRKLVVFRWFVFLLAAFYTKHTQSYHFELLDKGDEFPSIMVDAEFTITITAFKNNEQVGQKTIHTSDATNAQIIGTSGTRSMISLHFKDSVNWAFLFHLTGGTVDLNSHIQFIPSKVFPTSTVMDTLEFQYPKQIDAGLWTNSYQCDERTVTQYIAVSVPLTDITFEVKTSVYNFKAQAFSIIDGQYGTPVHCRGDSGGTTTTTTTTTTTKPTPTTTIKLTSTSPETPTSSKSTKSTTTTTTITTTKPKPTSMKSTTKSTTTTTTTPPAPTLPPAKVNTYALQDAGNPDVYCIVFAGKIEFEINYAGLNSINEVVDKTAKLGIPDQFSINGYCEKEQQELVITFNENWYLTLLFSKPQPETNLNVDSYVEDIAVNSKNGSKADLSYSISNITLSYTMDKTAFPNAFDSPETRYTLEVSKQDANNLPSKKSDESYYQCSNGTNVQLGNNAKIDLSSMKFKAFNKDDDTSFKGQPAQCKADKKITRKIHWEDFGYVMMVILAFLALIIVVAVVVKRRKRRRKRSGYRAI